jgi:hypothetical protein
LQANCIELNTLQVLAALARRLDTPAIKKLNVIPWAAPVISFGNLSHSKIATLGLNPSNREFVDLSGIELDGSFRRFHSLKSLGITRWAQASDAHFELILESCNDYFTGNPYDGWFRALDNLIIGANASYYGLFSAACHLDLVPYATACKWTELTSGQKTDLLAAGGNALGMLLRDSSIEVLVLNGRSVIDNLQIISGRTLHEEPIPGWTLPRRQTPDVTGYAYTGKISTVCDVALGREIAVLGYSHNIQSSFGVTSKVKGAIRDWITCTANKLLEVDCSNKRSIGASSLLTAGSSTKPYSSAHQR